MCAYLQSFFEFFVSGSVSVCAALFSLHFIDKNNLWPAVSLMALLAIAFGVFLVTGGFVHWLFFYD